MIHRLAKTSPYLSGQVRIDLIVNIHEDGLSYVDDVHVVPVSDNILFNESNSWNTLRYPHTDNIKHLYDIIGNNMFESVQDRNTTKWLYNDTGSKLDLIDHTYCMGARRMRYQRYGKQFCYFSPMWMYGTAGDFNLDRIRFELCVYNDTDAYKNSIYTVQFTDEVKAYLDAYLRIIDDKLLNINFETATCYIDGIHTPSGTHLNKEVNYLLYNMLSRERPLMEFDYLIFDTFIQNNIIAKQMVNLNFVFNMEDILPTHYNEYDHRDLNVVCRSYYDGEEVTVKDLYSNYDLIPSYTISQGYGGGTYSRDHNVLDYKHDYRCKDTVYDNRIVQPIFHWALENNAQYTFNMYNGFSPLMERDGDYERVSGYYNQPDLTFDRYDRALFNINWCMVYDLRTSGNAVIEMQSIRHNRYTCMGNPQNPENPIVYVNNVKYDYSTVNDGLDPEDEEEAQRIVDPSNYHVIIVILSDEDYADLHQQNTDDYIINADAEGGCSCLVRTFSDGSVYIILYLTESHINDVVFSNLMSKDIADDIVMNGLVRILRCSQLPYLIRYTNTVDPYYTSGPKLDGVSTQEIDFYNNPDVTIELYRYSDKLIPQLIDPRDEYLFNYTYRYIQWNESVDYGDMVIPLRTYNRYLNTGYTPYYPSVGYCALLKEEYRIDEIPAYYRSEEGGEFVEIPWYDAGTIIDMHATEVVDLQWDWDALFEGRKATKADLMNEVWNQLYDRVWTDDADTHVRAVRMNFLHSVYDYTIRQEYAYINRVSVYNYTFTFKLK